MAHSLVSPSAFSRTLKCPASLLANLWAPRTTSAAAQAGTDLHEVAETILLGQNLGLSLPEVPDSIAHYVHHCLALMDGAVDYGIESQVNFSRLADHRISCFGTIDFWAYKDGIVHIVDLKTGMSPVSPVNNAQLSLYAIGVVDMVAERYPDCEIREIHLSIAQGGEVATEVIDLTTLAEREVAYRHAIRQAFNVNPRFSDVPGPHCNFCPSQGWCPTQLMNARVALGLQAEIVQDRNDDAEVSDARYALVWRLGSQAGKAAEMAKEHLESKFLETGEIPAGVVTATYTPPRKWKDDERTALEIAGRLGWREAIEEGLLVPVSPTKATKALDGLEELVGEKESRLVLKLGRVD
jgi:hypothetical protein